ncbi:MCE family protein [Nocardia sp. NEAU-G5]|uniref:MCE family protein n=1 Tax=Nocardia albiluteola TaxID=2842303 RepID=A0ABS6BDT7_9NOCA|nr:MCE family protein [Nocardia albiluteola]MBU3067935.1 MCE family protein [Nocardia albiluteola]
MRHPVRVGALLLLGVLTLTTGGCSMSSRSGATHITAEFRSITGMFEGNPVTVLGIRVGRVDRIVPHDTYAEVHITVDGGVQLPQNVTAALISPSIVTDRHIELTPRYTGGPELPADAYLPLDRTRSPVELDTLLKTIDQFTAALRPRPGGTAGPLDADLLSRMLDGRGKQIHDTLAALTGALRTGAADRDAISHIIVTLDELTTTLAGNDRWVREFSNQISRMIELLAEQSPGLQATLDQLEAVLSGTGTAFYQYRDRLTSALTGLITVAEQLRANAAGVTEITDVLPLLLENLDGVVDRPGGHARGHVVLGAFFSGEIITTFCERIQMRADGCRTGDVQDLGLDFGLTAALLGLSR